MKNSNKTIKKILSIALCLALVVSYVPMAGMTASAVAAADITVTIDTGDEVTLQDTNGDYYYEIGSADELYAFAAAVNGGETYIYGKLTTDIVVNEGTMTAETTDARAWTPIGNRSCSYAGIFDGDGKSISGLYFNTSTTNYAGLFGYMDQDGTVKNTGVINSYFNGASYIGGVAGYIYNGDVQNCYNTGQVSGSNLHVGGVVGYIYYGVIENCRNTGTVSGNTNVGGVVGYNDGTMQSCYNIGQVSGSNYRVGGVVGYIGDVGSVQNCYYLSDNETDDIDGTTAKTVARFASGEVAYLLNGSTSDGVWKQSIGTDAAPNFTGKTVFYGYISCTDTARAYSNEALFADKPHSYENGTCTVCGEVCTHTVEATYAPTADGTQHVKMWSCCDAEVTEDHSTTADGDRAADCSSKAYCSVCESEYGDVDLTKHDDAMEHENGLCPNGCYEPATQNEDGYYEIGNAGQLMWFAQLVNNGETFANAILMADIDMDGIGTWSIMQTYDGTLDGNGYTIQGLNQNAGLGDGEQQGFIRRLTGTVKNTTFKNCSAFQQDSLGCAIIAYNNSGTIFGCMVVGCNVQLGNYGGLALVTGRNLSGGVIENCGVVGGNITRRFGGINNQGMAAITEQNGGTVQNCFAYGFNLNSNDSKLGALVYSGNAPVNSYYYYSGDKVFDSAVESIAKTAEQFASGEVAYLLQSGNTEQVWGQNSNQAGATPILDSTGLYKVVTVGKTGNYSISNIGDTNDDGTVDITDYQELVNKALSDDHEQIETASYDDIVKYDLDGDGYLDVLDAYLLHLFINGFTTVDVYAVGDYDLNGKAFEEADVFAMVEAMRNPENLATYQKYTCDMNADGMVDYYDLNILTSMFPLYFVGEE